MAKLNEVLSSITFADTNSDWEPITKYAQVPNYADVNYTTLINKNLSSIIGVSYSGEKNSQYVTFMADRYYDGIDLSEKTINICYKVDGVDVGGSDAPVNAFRNEDSIKFGWILPEQLTQDACTATIGILVLGTEYSKDYIWKSNTTSYAVEQGFICGDGIAKPDDDWFEQFVIEMDKKVKYVTDVAATLPKFNLGTYIIGVENGKFYIQDTV